MEVTAAADRIILILTRAWRGRNYLLAVAVAGAGCWRGTRMVVPDLNGVLVVYFLAKRLQHTRSRKNSIELLRYGRHRAKKRGHFVGIEPHLFGPEYAVGDGVNTA